MKIVLENLLILVFLMWSGAFAFYDKCLLLSNPVPRAEIGSATSNKEELIVNEFEDMRPLNFTTCVDEEGILAGIQFTLWSESN